MGLYSENGYLNVEEVLKINVPFIFIMGARGTGKTYGFLKYVLENNKQFILMRRTQSQADLINKPEFSPFKSVSKDTHIKVMTKPLSKYNAGIYRTELGEDNEPVPVGSPIGYTCALSTISNMRGFDASDVDLLIYDEFVPERHEKKFSNEGSAFLNAYETINRNRELQGRKPLQLIALGNSNDLTNAIFMELGLVKVGEKMEKNKQELYINRERGIAIIMLFNSAISKAKQETALYKLSKDSDFSRMALKNEFSANEFGLIISRDLREYKPLVTVGEITIYTHKKDLKYYVSTHKAGTVKTFGSGDIERSRFRKKYPWLWLSYMNNNIEFEEYLCQVLFEKSFDV